MENNAYKIEQLQTANEYSVWKFQVSILLNASGVFEYVNGGNQAPMKAESETQTAFDKRLSDWRKSDSKAQRIIATSIGSIPLRHIVNCTTAMEMWVKLRSVYEQTSKENIHMLLQKFYGFEKDPNDDVSTHISRLENIVRQLRDIGEIISESMIITKVLMTLPSNFKHFFCAWESTAKEYQTLENLTSRLVMEEARMSSHATSSSVALVAKQKTKKKNPKSSKSGKCFSCNEHGHWKRDCPKKIAAGDRRKWTGTRDEVRRGDALICNVDEKLKTGSSSEGRRGTLVSGLVTSRWTGSADEVQRRGSAIEEPDNSRWTGTQGEVQGEALIGCAASVTRDSTRNGNWYLDSGASDHMTCMKEWFACYREFTDPVAIKIGSGEKIFAQGIGEINILASDGNIWVEKHLSDVLYVPKISMNLFSQTRALDKNLSIISDNLQCRFLKKDGSVVAVGERQGQLFKMCFKVQAPTFGEANVASQVLPLKIWHKRMAHQNAVQVRNQLIKAGIQFKDDENFSCDDCVYGKHHHRLPFPQSNFQASQPGELVHADVCGPMEENSVGGSRYFLLFKDHFSRYKVVYFLKSKSDVCLYIEQFINRAKSECRNVVRTLRTDNGTEFVNEGVKSLLTKHCIRHETTVPYTPEQNGSVERENRTIVEAARTMLCGSGLSKGFWAEAVNTAVFVLNRTGVSSVKGKNPYELWWGCECKVLDLKTFGTPAFIHVPKQKRKKFDSKAEKGLFMGYAENTKGYRIWNSSSRQIQIVRDVIFKEGELKNQKDGDEDRSIVFSSREVDSENLDEDVHGGLDDNLHDGLHDDLHEEERDNTHDNVRGSVSDEHEVDFSGGTLEGSSSSSRPDFQEDNGGTKEDSSTSSGENFEEANLEDDVFDSMDEDDVGANKDVSYRNKLRSTKDWKSSGCINYAEKHAFLVQGEPINYKEAVSCVDARQWKSAMGEEVESLLKNRTWELVEKPTNRKIIDNKWVYKIKNLDAHRRRKYKARLVIRGFTQEYGVDYVETFSPVAKFISIRTVLAIAACEGLSLVQFDVKTAFLNGDLNEDIYMRQPLGFDDRSGKVYLPFQIAHKAHREELEGSLWLLKKILSLLPELLARRWQCHSLSGIMAKLLHLGNSSWLRKEGVRYFILWYQVLAENAPSYVHEMFIDLFPGLIAPQKGISVPDEEFDASDVFSHPNMRVEIGTSVYHDMMLHPVQNSEIVALFLPSSNNRGSPLDSIEGLEIFLNSLVQSAGSIKWRDNCAQRDSKSLVFLLNRFKEVFLPVFCPDFNNSNTIYEPKLVLPTMRTINKKDEVMSSCIVVLINWISRFVQEKVLNSKVENIYLQYMEHTLVLSDRRPIAYLQDKIIRDALYSTQSNINFIHEVLRQGFLLGFTTKSEIDAIRTSVAVYRDWMTSNNPPPFMLEPNEGDNNSTSCSSMDSALQTQKMKSNPNVGVFTQKSYNSIQAGLQNNIQVFVTNAANVFLLNTSNLNLVFPSSNREFQSTPLNEQTDICKKILNVYRTMVMNTRMEPKTWEQLLLVLLQVTSIVLSQNSIGSRLALGNRLGQAILQTLIVTWIRAHTNVPINAQLWERFLNVLTSLTSKDALINEWEKTMQTLTRVLGRYVYNLNLQDLPLNRLAYSKGKRRREASVWQTDLKAQNSRSSHVLNERNENILEEQKKKEEFNTVSASRIIATTLNLGRCYSEGSLATSRKTGLRVQYKKRTTKVKPLSFDESLSALLDQTNMHMNFEKLHFRNEDSTHLLKAGLLRRAISLNSLHLRNACYSTRNRDDDSLHGSRSPSPSASSGIEGGSIKDSPIDALVADSAIFEDNASVTSCERRSIILGGFVSGWLPGTAAIMWKRMLGSLGDVNLISRPELHAQVFKHLVEMTRNLVKIKHNQGVSEDNLSTPTPPSLVPPIGIVSPWCYGAQLLSPEYKKGQLSAIKILSILALNGSIRGRNHMSLFYNLLHKVFTDEDRQAISCLFKFLEGTRFLSLQLAGHTLLLLDIVHASDVLLTSNDPNNNSPRGEVIILLGSLLCYPASAIPRPVLHPSMQQIELMERPDLHDHILNIMLRCARREPSSKRRCLVLAQLGQWIYLELNRPNISKNHLKQSIHQCSPQPGDLDHSIASNHRIKEVIQVLLQALHFKHRILAVVAAGSLKICSDQSHVLSKIDNLPELIITALCKALEMQQVLSPQESDKVALFTIIMCLGEFCMSFPVNFMLESINKGSSLIVAVVRVLFHILSGEQQENTFKLLNYDTDFDQNISFDDVLVGKLNNEFNYHKSGTIHRNKLSITICAKSVIMHLVAHLGLFPLSIGASHLNSLVKEQDDIYLTNIADDHENIRDSVNCIRSQGYPSHGIEVFILNPGLIASFIDLPDLKLHTGCGISGPSTAEKQVRVLLRDLNGKSCWEASILYSNFRKSQNNLIYSQKKILQTIPNKKSLYYECKHLFYTITQLNEKVLSVSRHTIRHRPSNELPTASDLASDLDQLDDLLQYVGFFSPECLINSSAQINVPGMSPLGCQLEAQTISLLLNQRSIQQEYEANLHHFENDIELSNETSKESFEYFNAANMLSSKYPFQLWRLLFSHLGLTGWERRSRTHLLQRSEKLKRELRNVDIQKCRDTHKIAVVYVANGQEDKNSILRNTYGSSAYESFVSALGWEIDLETHNGFLGGLPRQGCGATAPYYATPFVEVIYHTATRMPSDTAEALLTKTRHLGNDEVHIVWSEHHREYRRDILPTEFCDVLIVVYPLKNYMFRVTVHWKPCVPWFGPLANESIVNGSCLAILVRETAINASRSKRSSLSLYQQYYEERNRSLENVSTLYKENSTFEDFANRVYSTNPIPLLGESDTGAGSKQLVASLLDKYDEKGWVQTTVDSTIRDFAHSLSPNESSPRVSRKLHPLKSAAK